ncbi:hypothetical protein D3C86_1871090 [compost metagenome]
MWGGEIQLAIQVTIVNRLVGVHPDTHRIIQPILVIDLVELLEGIHKLQAQCCVGRVRRFHEEVAYFVVDLTDLLVGLDNDTALNPHRSGQQADMVGLGVAVFASVGDGQQCGNRTDFRKQHNHHALDRVR